MRLPDPPKRDKLLYIETFGCQMNVNDSEKIVALLGDIGYVATADSTRADLVILNTCSVRSNAEQKVYNHLVQLKGLKKKNPRLILGVSGCVAQQEGERLLEKVSHLDLVVGTHNLHLLPGLVRGAEEGRRQAETSFIDTETRLDLFPAARRDGGVTRFVTIMQGCDNFCSYCIVPHVRGREVSRRSAEIVAEVREMAGSGVREVTLLGQNVNSYGLKSPGEVDFAGLIREIAAIDGIERIRFTTSNPRDVSPALIACFAEVPKLCSHFHLPAQSGSDRVLALMNRGYSRADYLATVWALRGARPDLLLTGDMIVGFPGETEADFRETLSLMEEVRYADLFSFIYSERPGTEAAGLPDDLSRAEKQERLVRLQEQQRVTTREINRSQVGSRQEVLVEGVSRRGDQLYGRTSGNRVVNFTGPVTLIGRIVPVRITADHQNSLLGEIHP